MAVPPVERIMSDDRADLRETWRTFFGEAYRDDVGQLAERYPQERSLYVDVLDLYEFDNEFTTALFAEPDRFLRAGAATLQELADPFERINVRLKNHPGLLGIGGLRSRHVAELVTVEGVTAEVDGVQSALETAAYVCGACGETERRRVAGRPMAARRCGSCGTAGALELTRESSTYVDVQRVRLESPPEGRGEEGPPAAIDALLDDDLVGTIGPGERLLTTGVVRLEPAAAENRFDFYLDVVSIDEEPGEVPAAGEGISGELQHTIESRWELLTDS